MWPSQRFVQLRIFRSARALGWSQQAQRCALRRKQTLSFRAPTSATHHSLKIRSVQNAVLNHSAALCSTASPSNGKADEDRSADTEKTEEATVTWLDRHFSHARAYPYLKLIRLDRPIGTHLLLWPCLWSSALAVHPLGGILPPLYDAARFAIGALIMRGAGCTINDMWDRDFDKKVLRTANRPLASGKLSMQQAGAFLAAQLTAGLGVLASFDTFTIAVGAASLPLVVAYPLMKRFTYWPQAFLGLTFNWGAFVGWSAAHGSLDLAATIPLYAAGISWTLLYDTIYAHQDKEDDVAAGVKSTALRFGDATKSWLSAFAVTTLGGLSAAGATVGMGPAFHALLWAAGGGHFAWQIHSLDIHNRPDCLRKFKSNATFAAAVFISICTGNALA